MKTNILLIVAAIMMTSCGGNRSESKLLSGDIKIDGSSTVFPLTEAVAEEFRVDFPEIDISIGISGTGGGFKKFGRGETDISNSSRRIKQQEIEATKANNINYVELSVAYDGLAVVVNPENDWVDKFTVEDLKKIWEPAAQGVIMKWNQVRPEWPDEELHLFGPGVASGTYDYFTEAVVGISGSSRGDFTASEDDNILVQGVSGDKYGLGFFGLAYFSENKEKLKLVSIDGGKGPVFPSVETVRNGTYYPLSRPLFIYVNSLAAGRPEVQEFIRFYIKTVGSMAVEVGYVPLPDEEYVRQKSVFDKFTGDSGEGNQ